MSWIQSGLFGNSCSTEYKNCRSTALKYVNMFPFCPNNIRGGIKRGRWCNICFLFAPFYDYGMCFTMLHVIAYILWAPVCVAVPLSLSRCMLGKYSAPEHHKWSRKKGWMWVREWKKEHNKITDEGKRRKWSNIQSRYLGVAATRWQHRLLVVLM